MNESMDGAYCFWSELDIEWELRRLALKNAKYQNATPKMHNTKLLRVRGWLLRLLRCL